MTPRHRRRRYRTAAARCRRELERRLRRETRGEALFDQAARGRYATDASIYQIMPAGVFIPCDDADLAIALDIARDLSIAVVPRGGGTSQCGQTVGAGLVIDNSKHLRHVLDIDAANRIAVVEPGLVLDHLNARLARTASGFRSTYRPARRRPWAAWRETIPAARAPSPTATWCTTCSASARGSSDGTRSASDRSTRSPAARRGSRLRARARGPSSREIVERWPKVMRRVGGYNLDIFDNQSERPYTADGEVNLAHLLIGSEGSLGLHPDAHLEARAAGRRIGSWASSNFPSFRASMEAPQHLVKLGPSRRRAGRPDHDRSRARQSELSAAPRGGPDREAGRRFCWSSSAARISPGSQSKLTALVALMGDLGLPGSVVSLTDPAAQKNLWEVRKAGLNIMMSLKGDGKPVSFIEDCAVPLEHLADYTDALTEIFARHGTHGTWYAHASVGTLHVRPILDMRRDGPEGGASRMRAIAEEAAALVRKFRGAYSGEHGDGICRGEWIRWQFGDSLIEAFRDIKRELDPLGDSSIRARSSIRRGWTIPRCFDSRRLRRANPYRTIAARAGARLVGMERAERPAHRGDHRPGIGRRRHPRLREGRRDVQQQRPLPPVRCRHDVPELPGHARRAAPHARARQYAAPGAVGTARPGRA